MSEIRVTNIIGETGVDAVNFTKGINATGIVTATSFAGSGAALTGIAAGGKINQVFTQVYEPGGSNITTNSTSYVTTSMTLQITPSNTNSKILIYNVGSKDNLSVIKLVNMLLDLMKTDTLDQNQTMLEI